MLREPHPLTYSREDAALTSMYCLEWSGSEELTANIISQLCAAFRQYGRNDICVLLFGECIKFGSLSPLYKGVLHENLATALRDIDPPRPKHMVREMKKALESYRVSRQPYRVCVALKNLGEAEWKLGYEDLAMDYFRQAKAQSQVLEQADRANVLVNLAVAAMRVGDRKLEIRYLSECLKECPEDWTEKILRINERLTELTR